MEVHDHEVGISKSIKSVSITVLHGVKIRRLSRFEYQKYENNRVPIKERFVIVNTAIMYFVKLKIIDIKEYKYLNRMCILCCVFYVSF
jgi:hypothetical protein